jgi:hypothetical protein
MEFQGRTPGGTLIRGQTHKSPNCDQKLLIRNWVIYASVPELELPWEKGIRLLSKEEKRLFRRCRQFFQGPSERHYNRVG